MLNFTSLFKSKLICIISFGGVACLVAYENLQGNYFLRFFLAFCQGLAFDLCVSAFLMKR